MKTPGALVIKRDFEAIKTRRLMDILVQNYRKLPVIVHLSNCAIKFVFFSSFRLDFKVKGRKTKRSETLSTLAFYSQ